MLLLLLATAAATANRKLPESMHTLPSGLKPGMTIKIKGIKGAAEDGELEFSFGPELTEVKRMKYTEEIDDVPLQLKYLGEKKLFQCHWKTGNIYWQQQAPKKDKELKGTELGSTFDLRFHFGKKVLDIYVDGKKQDFGKDCVHNYTALLESKPIYFHGKMTINEVEAYGREHNLAAKNYGLTPSKGGELRLSGYIGTATENVKFNLLDCEGNFPAQFKFVKNQGSKKFELSVYHKYKPNGWPTVGTSLDNKEFLTPGGLFDFVIEYRLNGQQKHVFKLVNKIRNDGFVEFTSDTYGRIGTFRSELSNEDSESRMDYVKQQ